MRAARRKTEARYGGKRFLMTSLEHLDPAIPKASATVIRLFFIYFKKFEWTSSHLLQTKLVPFTELPCFL